VIVHYQKRKVSAHVSSRATDLYFEIEKHFLTGGGPLTVREVGLMLGCKPNSVGLAFHYIRILDHWGLIKRSSFDQRTIVLAERNYPPVEWRQMK
jgi:hypothetical protein